MRGTTETISGRGETRYKAQLRCFSDTNLCIFNLYASLPLVSVPHQLPDSLDSSLHGVSDSSFFPATSQV